MNGAIPFSEETNHLILEANPNFLVSNEKDGIYLSFDWDKSISKMRNLLVTTELLGKAKIPGQKYENPDGSAITIDYDYSGNQRNTKNPTAGPFENLSPGKNKIKVWDFE